MRISVELVPRCETRLREELVSVKTQLPQVSAVNIPDLVRFELRSWQACQQAKQFVNHAIPHIRARDIDLNKPLRLAPYLQQHDMNEVLIVTGDASTEKACTGSATSSLDVIRKFRQELPSIRIYAALDPYRYNLVTERDYALEKLAAGADGFFTQPFFDLRLMEVYAELLPPVTLFWGLTAITSMRSLRYWQTQNHAVVPAGFEPSLAWSREFARQALTFIRQREDNVYFMPIKTDIVSYLQDLL